MSTAGGPRFYAGIGSRKTPPGILDVMRRYAAWREARGDHLRSGGAPGADTAFYEGLSEAGRSQAQVLLPGPSFNGNVVSMPGMIDATALPAFAQALETVNQFHPNPEALANARDPKFVRSMMARNAMQVLGPDLQSPSVEVVAWTEGGKLKGGTAQALRIARRHGVPITNLGDPATLARIQNLIRDVPPMVAAGRGAGWARQAANGYEVSSAGDRRFSALNARLRDGRTIEEAYQLDVKGYRDQGATHWKAGKGKPPVNGKTPEQLYQEYRGLWDTWAAENPQLIDELAAAAQGRPLTDRFASTPVNQARALAEILAARPAPAGPDYGRTFQIVRETEPHDVWGMRSGPKGIYNMTNTAPGRRGWLGNPDRANDAGGVITRKQATEAFFKDFVERYQSDPVFRAAAQGLVGKRVAYYKPDEQWVHLKPVQEWLASRDFAADNGEVVEAPAPLPPKESLQQLELAIDEVTPGKVRWAGQVLPVLALAASIGLGGAALAKAVSHPDGTQG